VAKTVTCPCGEVLTGDTDDELVKVAQTHGREKHGQEVPPALILQHATEA
jgi:hypothetical protein